MSLGCRDWSSQTLSCGCLPGIKDQHSGAKHSFTGQDLAGKDSAISCDVQQVTPAEKEILTFKLLEADHVTTKPVEPCIQPSIDELVETGE